MALQRAVYRPCDAEHSVLHRVIAEHLEAFLGTAAEVVEGRACRSSSSWGQIRNRQALLSSDVDLMKALGGGSYAAEVTAAT